MTLGILGNIASVLIIISMVFKTTSFKGTILMRTMNAIGSILFTLYGFWPIGEGHLEVNAFATGFTNSILFILNIFYLIKETIDHKKEIKNAKER